MSEHGTNYRDDSESSLICISEQAIPELLALTVSKHAVDFHRQSAACG